MLPCAAANPQKHFMEQKLKTLDNYHVASPCAMTWETMTGDVMVRDCRQCSRNVYNLSAMTRGEAERLISTTKGRLCVRLDLRADGKIQTTDAFQAPRSCGCPRASRIAAAALATLLTLYPNTFAQPTKPAHEAPQQIAPHRAKRLRQSRPASGKQMTLHGTVYDSQEAVIPFVKIVLLEERTGREFTVETNEEGVYTFPSLEPGLYTLTTTANGFARFQQPHLKLHKNDVARFDVYMQVAVVGEIVLVDRQPVVENSGSKKVINVLLLPYRGVKKLITGNSH